MTTPDLTLVTWRKSTRSSASGSDCIEVAKAPGVMAVRDSKNPTGPVLIFGHRAWAEFVTDLPEATTSR